MGLLLSSVTNVYAQVNSNSFNVRFYAGSDTTPPTTPVLLQANPISPTQIDLQWAPSTDNFYLQGYVVSRGTSTIATTSATSFSDTSVSAGTTYSYSIRAFDAAGNYSSSSNSIATTTPDYPVVVPPVVVETEETPPQGTVARVVVQDVTVTPGLTTASVAVKSARPVRLTIRWGRSSDYELGYAVSEYYSTTHVSSLTDLEPGTTYEYEISAETPFGLEAVVGAGQFTTLTGSGSSIPANVRHFTATPQNTDVRLSWQLPVMEDVAFVRVVRSYFGFPEYPQNGAVIYQGTGSQFTDADILSQYSPVYYTAFVYSADGKVSSGAIAMAFAQSSTGPSGQDSNPGGMIPSIPNPPIKVPEATSSIDQEYVTPDMRLPELSDIYILQNGLEYSYIGSSIALSSTKSFVVRIPAQAVAGNLKSIIGTLLDPTNNELGYSFLLRLNEDKTYYEAGIPAVMVVGQSVLELDIYDYEAFTVATYKVPIHFVEDIQDKSTVLFPDIFFRDPVPLVVLGSVLGILGFILLAFFRRRHEDKV